MGDSAVLDSITQIKEVFGVAGPLRSEANDGRHPGMTTVTETDMDTLIKISQAYRAWSA